MNATTLVSLTAYAGLGMSYPQYRQLGLDLMALGRTTGGEDYQTPELLEYNRLNITRMNRLDKTAALMPELEQQLQEIRQPQHWLLLTESWCGDAAQIVPVIAKMAAANPLIRLELFLRDKHLELMDAYLQNGRSRSIPKLIVAGNDGQELFHWGPRPQTLQVIYDELRAANSPFEKMSTELHSWYAKDRTVSTQTELSEKLKASDRQ